MNLSIKFKKKMRQNIFATNNTYLIIKKEQDFIELIKRYVLLLI